MMLNTIKLLYRDLSSPSHLYLYKAHLRKNIPGILGRGLRARFYKKYLKYAGMNLNIQEGVTIVHPELVECGDNVGIGVGSFLQAGGTIKIGNDVLFGPYAKIWSQNHIFVDPNIAIKDQGYDYKPVIIGNNVWIGTCAMIMPGTNIGDGCIISAHAVVSAKEYPPGTILAGNPARKIGERK